MGEKIPVASATLSIMRLYAGDYRLSLHMREIARRVGADVSSVRIHLQRLERINVLGRSKAGRNIAFSPNLNNLFTRQYMVMAESFASVEYMRRHYIAKRVLKDLDTHVDGALVLFGSYAREEHDDESDVDLLVVGPRIRDKGVVDDVRKMAGTWLDIKYATPRQVSLGLRRGDPLIREAVSNHVVLKGADAFCGAVWRCYVGQ